MANTELNDELEESGGGFSRFLFFITPILFTIVLLGVLFALFNIDFKNSMIDFGNKIPIIKNFVPDSQTPESGKKKEDDKKQQASTEATLKQLKEQVAKQEAELEKANQLVMEQENKVTELQTQLATAVQQDEDKKQAEELAAYEKEVKKLANIYSEMSPSKAAAIFDKLTTDETLQMLSVMNNESKVAILEKMDPQKAADISILLKDVKSSEDLAIAALQSRLKKEESPDTKSETTSNSLNDNQLAQTFSSMSADSASKLIIQTYKLNPQKALRILTAVNDTARSKILNAMTEEDEQLSVKILNQLIDK